MRTVLIVCLIIGTLLIIGCSGSDKNTKDFPKQEGMPNPENMSTNPGGMPTPREMPNRNDSSRMMNFSLDEESINAVTEFFQNAESQEDVSEYCAEHMMECSYYCRQVNPDNELCSVLPQGNRPPGN